MPQKHTAARPRVPGRHARGRNIQVFWQRNSGPAHSTLQFGAESGEDSSGTGQQRGSPGPRWQQNHLDSCSHQHPGPSSRPLHTNSRCGTNTQRHDHGLLLGGTMAACTCHPQVHCDHMGLTCFNSHLLWGRASTCWWKMNQLVNEDMKSFIQDKFEDYNTDREPQKALRILLVRSQVTVI